MLVSPCRLEYRFGELPEDLIKRKHILSITEKYSRYPFIIRKKSKGIEKIGGIK